MRQLTIGKNDCDKRIDKFLLKALKDMPNSLLYKLIRTKRIKLNGKRTQPGEILKENDVITLYIADEFFNDGSTEIQKINKLENKYLDLAPNEIVYEDENVILIDKPQGELVHSQMPDEKPVDSQETCLVDRLCGYLYKKGEYDPYSSNGFTPSLCNRLDRNTCGIVIAAKNPRALAILNDKVKYREMEKKYLCMVYGVPQKKTALLKDFLYKDKKANRVFVFPTHEAAKKSLNIKYDDDIKSIITKYEVLKEYKDKSLLEVELITGRTHQIRAHLAYIGHPIIGDGKYGVNHKSKSGVQYQMLCSYYLKFKFKTDGGILSYLDGMEFYSGFDLSSLQ